MIGRGVKILSKPERTLEYRWGATRRTSMRILRLMGVILAAAAGVFVLSGCHTSRGYVTYYDDDYYCPPPPAYYDHCH